MKAALVIEAGKTPIYGDFKEPIPADGEVLVTISAAALSNVVKSRASGTHYSSSGQFPFVVGIDGVDSPRRSGRPVSELSFLTPFRERRS